MAFSKARRLGDLITANAEQFITSAHITDTAITGSDIHSTFDLTGKTVTVATASAGDNDTSAASTAFVQQEIASLVDSAPGTLNTLNELAAALGDDANFSTTVTNSIATKAPLASPSFTGNVGIGDTSPAAKLEIKQGSANWYEGIRINRSSNTTQFGTFSNNSGATFIGAVDSAGGSNNAILFGNSTDGTTFTERMRIDSSGKVGIGTTSPLGKLSIQEGSSGGSANSNADGLVIDNNGKTGITILTPNDSEGLIFFADPDDDNIGRITYNHSTNAMGFVTNNSTALTVDSSGNVGIGITDPDQALEIGAGGKLKLSRADNARSMLLFTDNNNATIQSDYDPLLIESAHRMVFNTNGANERMRITTGGKVFIGSSNEGAYGGLGDLVFQQSADDLGIGIIDDNETNTLKLINNGTVSKIEQNGAIPIQIKNANGVLAEFKTYAVPKMNFHYANNNIYQVSTTADEESSGQGVMILKQQISVSAGSKIIVWYDTGQILNNNQGGNGSANSNPHIAVYVSSNGTAPSNRGDAHMINSQTNHYWYPAGSQGSARLKMNGMGATGTISTAGTYYIYVYGGSYNSGSYTFNYQNSSSNTRGCNIIWAEVMA